MADAERLYRLVRSLYDAYRSVSMNRKYYGYRLNSVRKWDSVLEIFIALGASSTVGAWALWQSDVGKAIWGVFGGLVAMLAIVKPFLQLSKHVERYSKLFTGYGNIHYEMESLVLEVEKRQNYTKEIDTTFNKTWEKLKILSADDDPLPNRRLVQRCFDEVNVEIPVNRLWWPKKRPAAPTLKGKKKKKPRTR